MFLSADKTNDYCAAERPAPICNCLSERLLWLIVFLAAAAPQLLCRIMQKVFHIHAMQTQTRKKTHECRERRPRPRRVTAVRHEVGRWEHALHCQGSQYIPNSAYFHLMHNNHGKIWILCDSERFSDNLTILGRRNWFLNCSSRLYRIQNILIFKN